MLSSSMMSCCCIIVDADYPGLRNAAAIEDLRRHILNAFRAYTTGLSICLSVCHISFHWQHERHYSVYGMPVNSFILSIKFVVFILFVAFSHIRTLNILWDWRPCIPITLYTTGDNHWSICRQCQSCLLSLPISLKRPSDEAILKQISSICATISIQYQRVTDTRPLIANTYIGIASRIGVTW